MLRLGNANQFRVTETQHKQDNNDIVVIANACCRAEPKKNKEKNLWVVGVGITIGVGRQQVGDLPSPKC
jgi:hypothetical protein